LLAFRLDLAIITVMSNLFEKLWVEKYRPHSIDDYVCSDKVKEVLLGMKDQQSFPNILLCGIQGTGKTTLAKMLVNDIVQSDYIYINASDERGIDTIRNRVKSFVETRSITKFKTVILDEACGLTDDAQRALKALTEEFSDTARFILTANNINRISAPIQSRFVKIDISPTLAGAYKRLISILVSEKIPFGDVEKAYLAKIVKNNIHNKVPDIRKCINTLQSSIVDGKVSPDTEETFSVAFVDELMTKLKAGTRQARQFYLDNERKFSGDYPRLLRRVVDYIYENDPVEIGDEKIVIINEYLDKSTRVIDQEINAYACFVCISRQS